MLKMCVAIVTLHVTSCQEAKLILFIANDTPKITDPRRNKFRRNLKWKIVKEILKKEQEESKMSLNYSNYEFFMDFIESSLGMREREQLENQIGSPWRVSKQGSGLTYKFNEDRIIIKEE